MDDPKESLDDGDDKNVKRNLPSWMASRENESKSHGKKHTHVGAHGKSNETQKKSSPSKSNASGFSKLMERVVFVLSGFVNPERSVLRSQALEMGAEYQPDWNPDCTLLVCAFPNTPKFQQVEAGGGTIVSKEWISECYNQKKLVDIESYLMHAGKPWRRQSTSHEASQDQEPSKSRKFQKQVERGSHLKPSASSKTDSSKPAKDFFSTSTLKKWAINDLNNTISWLESQEEKPEPSVIKKVAAEGILTCLEDAIDSFKQEQDIQQITEQWNFIPRVVEELAKLEGAGSGSTLLSKEDLYRQAMACKQIYEVELGHSDDDSLVKMKKPTTDGSERSANASKSILARNAVAYDSDETIEMTEEEIDQAYNTVASKLCKC
ncbi:unnamed protein product [Ilex paraguariensis]|uniref:BRCT domain-containing protein n=1 Tax=Ilex paraguariensis TaxID=185542 RepID=A0ABC8UX68_9AQUA